GRRPAAEREARPRPEPAALTGPAAGGPPRVEPASVSPCPARVASAVRRGPRHPGPFAAGTPSAASLPHVVGGAGPQPTARAREAHMPRIDELRKKLLAHRNALLRQVTHVEDDLRWLDSSVHSET